MSEKVRDPQGFFPGSPDFIGDESVASVDYSFKEAIC
jgi:hypothetical protein